ncbi:unnamed protein product [Prorocentrum cordatum]|uniref:Uncharacterized protein n=1 Tax=Prorocentrum cordatum TaxID=2364126 RepID=A0ABN9T1G2_9DINO|nr:unnamed protein product [Polarella glacialis]
MLQRLAACLAVAALRLRGAAAAARFGEGLMGAVKEAQKAVDAARVQNVAERVAGRAHEVLKESVPEQVFQGGADFTHDGLLPPPRPGEALQAKANAILELPARLRCLATAFALLLLEGL